MTLLLTDRAQRYKLWIETFEKSCSEHDATQQMCVYPTVLPAPTRDSALLILWCQATLRRDVDGGSAPRRWDFRSLWRVAGSSGSDSDSRPRVDEFGKKSRAGECCPTPLPLRITSSDPDGTTSLEYFLWWRVSISGGSDARLWGRCEAPATSRPNLRECGASESFYRAHSALLGNQSYESSDWEPLKSTHFCKDGKRPNRPGRYHP